MTRKIISVMALLALLLTLSVAFVSCKDNEKTTDTSTVEVSDSTGDSTNQNTENNSGETNNGETGNSETDNSNENDQKYGEFHFNFGN